MSTPPSTTPILTPSQAAVLTVAQMAAALATFDNMERGPDYYATAAWALFDAVKARAPKGEGAPSVSIPVNAIAAQAMGMTPPRTTASAASSALGTEDDALDEPDCPNCGGPMWDNRADKKNPKAPDFKCKAARTTGCEGVLWPPRNGKR